MSENNAPETAEPSIFGSSRRKPFKGGKRRLYNVVRLRFKANFISHDYDARLLELRQGDHVIVETSRGPALATVTSEVNRVVMGKGSLKRVLRKASKADLEREVTNAKREREAFKHGLERIRERNLPMKLIQVHCMHDGSKIIFYFSADGRIDFRQLVRDLAQRFRTRIEMRQIGARDGARMIGGIGPCGRELCCSTFLENFSPVSIRMAKDQGLTLNPRKVSGMCGRLMCCLVYEQQIYHRARKRLPRAGKTVETAEGLGTIRTVDLVQEKVQVKLEDGRYEHFPVREVQVMTPRDLERREAREVARREKAESEPEEGTFEEALREAALGEDEYLWEDPDKQKKKDGERKPRDNNRRRGRRSSGNRKPGPRGEKSARSGEKPAEADGNKADGNKADGAERKRRRGRGRGRGGPGGGGNQASGDRGGARSTERRRGQKPPEGGGDKPAPQASGGEDGEKPKRNRRRRRRRPATGKKPPESSE